MKLLFLFFSLLQIQFTQLDQFISKYKLQKNTAHFGVSMSIRDEKGKEIYAKDSKTNFAPASTLKLISTGFALETLGADYKFQTKLFYSGFIENGILNGNLILENNYNPAFLNAESDTNTMMHLIRDIQKTGIRKINGKILIKQDSPEDFPTRWLLSDLGNYYGALPRFFNYKENQYALTYNTLNTNTEYTQLTNVDLGYEGAKIISKVKNGSAGSGDQSNIITLPFSKDILVVGTLAAGNEAYKIKGANMFPEETFLTDFKIALSKENINTNNSEINTENLNLINTYYSKPLTELIKICNYESDNFLAESFRMAVEPNFKKYRTMLGEWLNLKSVDISNSAIYDASGLSPQNAISTSIFSNYLFEMKENSFFYESLATLGRDGTLKNLDQKNISKGNIKAKSGTLSNVKAYIGYIKTRKRGINTFSVVIHGLGEKQEKQARIMAEELILKTYKILDVK